MLKDIAGITIKGANFATDTSLMLFDPSEGNKIKNVKGTLLYGRNGSGKSTIAKAIRTINGETDLPISASSFFDSQGSVVTLTDDEKKHIFVFDEDYVSSKVKVMESGLGSIVMLGEQADLTTQIEEAEREYENAKTAFEQTDIEYKEYLDSENEKAPSYYLSKMNLALSGDANWSGRDREIHDNRRNSSVGNDTYKRFIELSPQKTRDELLALYRDKKKELTDAQNGASKIEVVISLPSTTYKSFDIDAATELIGRVIEKPELSEREQYLLGLLQEGKGDQLQHRIEFFRKPGVAFCPMCLQDLSEEYKSGLVAKIERVLSKIVEEHRSALQELILCSYDIDISDLSAMASYEKCTTAIEALNQAIKDNNALIQKKIDDPYTVPEGNLIKLAPLSQEVELHIKQLSKEQTEYNKKVTNTGPIITALEKINSEIAYHDIKNFYEKYVKQKEEAENVKKAYDDAKENKSNKEQKIRKLEAQRSNIRIATDVLNRAFKYIFFSDNRLSIELEDNQYKLLSKGKQVKPCDVSVGERNIIGLCYFFVSILEGKEELQAFGDEYLIVIDDPVSSYDFENRIGILSFIKYELNRFLVSNANSRALLLTHDLNTFFSVEKIFDEVLKQFNKTYKFNIFELQNENLKPFHYKKRQEYTELVQIIYSYANGPATEFDLVIGNIMRQTLEAFATFTYKKGIEEVSTDRLILAEIKEEYRDYFENLMYRLVLNGGSHREEQARNLEVDFYSVISEQEKRRTARDILCFIYCLNQRHLLSHLPDNSETVIDGWCTQIATLQSEVINAGE